MAHGANANGHKWQTNKGIIMAILAMIKGHTGNDQGPLNGNTNRQ